MMYLSLSIGQCLKIKEKPSSLKGSNTKKSKKMKCHCIKRRPQNVALIVSMELRNSRLQRVFSPFQVTSSILTFSGYNEYSYLFRLHILNLPLRLRTLKKNKENIIRDNTKKAHGYNFTK